MKFGDDQSVQTIIKSVVYKYPFISIRYTFSDTELIFLLRRGDKEYEYHIPSYDLISLYTIEIEGKLITIIEDKLISKKSISKKEEDMTLNLGTVDMSADTLTTRIHECLCNAKPLTTDHIVGLGSAKSVKALINDIVINLSATRAFSPKKIIKSGPCTIVIWEDGTKTIVRLREGEKDDEFAAFSAAVVKKIYGSNSAVTKLLKKKTFVQEKKESSGDMIPKTEGGDKWPRDIEKIIM